MGGAEKAEENSNLWGHRQHIAACLINAHHSAEVPSHPAASTRTRARARRFATVGQMTPRS